MKEGDEWYLVAVPWYKDWKDYINQLSIFLPGAIDNSPLVNDRNELLSDVTEYK